MYGEPDSTLLVLGSYPFEQGSLNALQACAERLGHVSGACCATLEEAGDDLAAFIVAADPWSVLAVDDAAIEALRLAFAPASCELAAEHPVHIALGYELVAVPGFTACLHDADAKRVAWRRMKAARHPGNPLETASPKRTRT